ncbi:MAG TPA: F0F1 ATP synthase subunit B [Bacteroidetes bacterium]|nr:F0F1 ATP synthase subunit B [Bacteroidota bacterium]
MILASNSLTTPELGTIVWTTLIFLMLLVILRAFAWKPIMQAIKAREESIKGSLESAEEARREMERLKADNEAIMAEARSERDELMKEARDARDKMIAEAKKQAKTEADKMIQKARTGIEREKTMAINDIRNQIASLSVEIAEKILNEKLKEGNEQNKLIAKLLDDMDLKEN